MNREKLTLLRDHIAKSVHRYDETPMRNIGKGVPFFDMNHYASEVPDFITWVDADHVPICKTAACLAGHTVLLFKGKDEYMKRVAKGGDYVYIDAMQELELTENEAELLFTPGRVLIWSNYDAIRPEDAVHAINELLDGKEPFRQFYADRACEEDEEYEDGIHS